MLHLIGVAGLFNEKQLVLIGGGHMGIKIPQEVGRVYVSEIVIGANQ